MRKKDRLQKGECLSQKKRDLEAVTMATSPCNIPDLLPRQHQSLSYCVSFLMCITGAKFQLQCLNISISFRDWSLHCNHLRGHRLIISRTREDIEKTAFLFIFKCLSGMVFTQWWLDTVRKAWWIVILANHVESLNQDEKSTWRPLTGM